MMVLFRFGSNKPDSLRAHCLCERPKLCACVCVCFRQRKDELEQRMSSLQESRRELMVQLEGLMKLLKVHQTHRARPALFNYTDFLVHCNISATGGCHSLQCLSSELLPFLTHLIQFPSFRIRVDRVNTCSLHRFFTPCSFPPSLSCSCRMRSRDKL